MISSVQEECWSLYLKLIHIVTQDWELGAYLLRIKQNYLAIWYKIACYISSLISSDLLPLNMDISWAPIHEQIEK